MKIKRIIVDFLGTAALVFVVTAGVTYLYSLIVYGLGDIDWDTAFRLAIILGIVLTFTRIKKPL